jgi:hypothetical protein
MKQNKELCKIIQDLLILGYTIPELADQWGISKTNLTTKYSIVKNRNKYLRKVKFHGKEEPYHVNEWMYGFIPSYNFEELSYKEKQFYYNNLKKNN